MHDLAIIVVSTNEAQWLERCLRTVFERAGEADLDLVVVDNASTDGTRELVENGFPQARVVDSENHGFSHANNRGILSTDARYVLLLNPDTEILAGTFEQLVAALDERPEVGAAGVKQVTPDGELFPTIRRSPNALRAFGEAFFSERLPFRTRWLGERELDLGAYERETPCDWTSGSFLLVRREAMESAGMLDERFFIYAEETDWCRRIKRAGWDIRHLPTMTILHHADKAGYNPKMEAQAVFARLQYARKNFSPLHRAAYVAALGTRHLVRSTVFGSEVARERRLASRGALRTLVGREAPPFGPPPPHALAPDARQRLPPREPAELPDASPQ